MKMPPKSVCCSVCGETVLKSQTLARKDGTRACRSHDGIQSESNEIKQQHKESQEKHTKKKGNPREAINTLDDLLNQDLEIMKRIHHRVKEQLNNCWICNQEGVSFREYCFDKIVALKRLEMRNEFNFLTMNQDCAKLIPNNRVLFHLPYGDEKSLLYRRLCKESYREMVPFYGYVQVCAECAYSMGYGKEIEKSIPNVSVDEALDFSPMLVHLEPHIEAVAKKKENQS
jgi:hypothetical protein